MSREGERSARELHPELSPGERARLHRQATRLFDAGRYFESHEPWEEIWRSTTPEPRDLWQGLVQVAAGLHHWFDRGRAAPAARLLRRGLTRLDRFGDEQAGFDVVSFRARIGRWAAWLERGAQGEPPEPPWIVESEGGGNQR